MTVWRLMAAPDLATVAAIERESHNPLPPEGFSIFANRLEKFPAGCFVAGEPAGGYAIAHPWAGSRARDVGWVLEQLSPSDGSCCCSRRTASGCRARRRRCSVFVQTSAAGTMVTGNGWSRVSAVSPVARPISA